MAQTRTNWFLDDLGVDDTDPFAGRVEDDGTQLDLTADLDQIHAAIKTALEREQAMFDRGTTCPIKENPQSICAVCPVRHTGHEDPMTPLCELGMEQERLLTRVAVARAGVL